MRVRLLLAALLTLVPLSVSAQVWDQVGGSMQVKSGPAAPLVIIDQTAAGQKIASFRSNGTEKCYIDVSGNLNCAGIFTLTGQSLAGDGSASAPSYSFASNPATGIFKFNASTDQIEFSANGTSYLRTGAGVFLLQAQTPVTWASTNDAHGGSADVSLSRRAAYNPLFASSTNAYRLDVANTYTSTTNNELFSVDWQTTANTAMVGTRTAATGTRRPLRLVSQSTNGADAYATLKIDLVSLPIFKAGYFNAVLSNVSDSTAGTWFSLGEFTSTATSGTVVNTAILPTYNQSSGTAANCDFCIDRTETAVGSGPQTFIGASVGGTRRYTLTAGGASGRGTTETFTQSTAPTCSSNCGTSPSVTGSDTAGRVTMGSSGVPASGWVVTFNGTWANAPVCQVWSSKTGMVVGKMPIVVVTSTTTFTVTTNGTAPATTDTYDYRCTGIQ